MSKAEEYADFLSNIHLFQDISEDLLFDLADSFQEKSFAEKEVIFAEKERASKFFLIYSGEVEVTFLGEDKRKTTYMRGDYLGAEALIPGDDNALIEAKNDVVLLELQGASSENLANAIEFLRERLSISQNCREMINEKKCEWLNDGEVIYFLKRKHIILFWRGLLIPAFISIIGAIFMAFWWVNDVNIFWTLGIFFLIMPIFLVAWRWADWRNDYYIITNQRLIWLEKIIGIYDSRQEANLGEVLSVSVNTDAITQNFFDYGKVSVRVMVGGMDLDYMPHPHYAKYLLDELVGRTKAKSEEQTKEQIKQAIINKIRNPNPAPTKTKKAPPKKKTLKESLFPKKERHIFEQRFEQGGDIIYRKHWVVLIRLVGIPLSVSLFFISFFLYQLYLTLVASENVLSTSAIALLGLAAVISIGSAWYQYADWSNDIFKVSKDKIFDIDRKPFGDEQSRSAPLENIESLKYKRKGFFSIFFNYGTVYIHIGAENFEFEDVWNPASVQQDINRRYMEDHYKKKEGAEKKEQNQWIDWLVTYHQSAKELQALIDKLEKEKEGEK